MSLDCCDHTERGKACADTDRSICGSGAREGEHPAGALSTVAARAGGPARSSGETPVTGVE